MTTPDGFWTTDAPLSPEMVDEDRAGLVGLTIPEGVLLQSAEVYINGRLWRWERMPASFGDIRRDPGAGGATE